MWGNFKNINNEKLKGLARLLPSVILGSRQGGTVKSYASGYQKWRKWTESFQEVVALPADPKYVALYLTDILNNAASPAPVLNAFYSISWSHQMAGLDDHTQHDLPKRVKDAANRLIPHGLNKKSPIAVKDLTVLIEKFANVNSSLSDVRTARMAVLAFVGFFRFKELRFIKRSDVTFDSDHVNIFIESSKTDVFRVGNWVHLSKINSQCCPYLLLDRYLHMYIFRAITNVKSGQQLRPSNAPISYTRCRELMLQAFKLIGLDTKSYCTHSFRAGGATAAAANRVPDRLFKKHGRWRSERAKDGYVSESINDKLSVSRSLGL